MIQRFTNKYRDVELRINIDRGEMLSVWGWSGKDSEEKAFALGVMAVGREPWGKEGGHLLVVSEENQGSWC